MSDIDAVDVSSIFCQSLVLPTGLITVKYVNYI